GRQGGTGCSGCRTATSRFLRTRTWRFSCFLAVLGDQRRGEERKFSHFNKGWGWGVGRERDVPKDLYFGQSGGFMTVSAVETRPSLLNSALSAQSAQFA